jgi:hypothetical protein
VTRLLFISVLGLSLTALAGERPAALQVCLSLPDGVALFATSPQPFMRALGNGVWMLDFEFQLDGHGVERITKSGPDCFRAWLPAENVSGLSFDFSKVPLNLVNQEPRVSVQLKPDLWSDGGRFVVDRAPWSNVVNATNGTLVLEREDTVMTDWQQLPAGRYVVKFTPPPPPKTDCAVTLQLHGVGSVRHDRNAALLRELTEHYRKELLPSVIKKHQLQCEPAEVVQVTVKVDDGAIRNPLEPRIERVRLEEKELQYQVTIDGRTLPFVEGMTVVVGPGQTLEFSERSLRAER